MLGGNLQASEKALIALGQRPGDVLLEEVVEPLAMRENRKQSLEIALDYKIHINSST